MNKDNAHLYLPLVQALAEGKDVEFLMSDNKWRSANSSLGVDFTYAPDRYRIKPLDFAPIPEGAVRHNPDGLTPEQVGEGWRLLTEEERVANCNSDAPFRKEVELWREGEWDSTMWRGCAITATFRVPLSTPYPDGSFVKDGKLVKPWKPRFKVGDRVKVNLYAGASEVGKVTRVEIPTDIQPRSYVVEYDKGGGSGGWVFENQLEPAPWSLSRHLPGFRPLRDGEEWHRMDWTEESLPNGYRPLLLGEARQIGDEHQASSGWFQVDSFPACENKFGPLYSHCRTRRPLPEPAPEPTKVPLTAEDWMKDGPWWVRSSEEDKAPSMVVAVNVHNISYGRYGSSSHEDAMNLQRSNDGITWTPCWKLA